MKKLLASVLAASLLAMGTAAFATAPSYDVDVNGANVPEASNAQTILITAGDKTAAAEITADKIVYINQSDDANGFGTAVKFLLKAGVTEGTYTVRTNTEPGGATFEISEKAAAGLKDMTALDRTETPDDRWGFTMESVLISNYQYLVVQCTQNGEEKSLKYELSKFGLTGIEAAIKFGLQINDVPSEVTAMTVSLAKSDPATAAPTVTE